MEEVKKNLLETFNNIMQFGVSSNIYIQYTFFVWYNKEMGPKSSDLENTLINNYNTTATIK